MLWSRGPGFKSRTSPYAHLELAVILIRQKVLSDIGHDVNQTQTTFGKLSFDIILKKHGARSQNSMTSLLHFM